MSVLSEEQKKKNSLNSLKEDYVELINSVNPEIVKIERMPVTPGSALMAKLKVTFHGPTHYLERGDNSHPIPTDHLVFYVDVRNGYPAAGVQVYYEPDRRLASVNVYSHGVQCTDVWVEGSDLRGVVHKTLLDIIHHASVTRYDSMANRSLKEWQKGNQESGVFPTIPASRLERAERGLPPVQSAPTRRPAPPLPRALPNNA